MSFTKREGLSVARRLDRYITFLRWWMLFTLVSLGSVVLFLSGVLGKINEGDFTKISFLIYAVFSIFTVRTGIDTYRFCKENDAEITNGRIAFYQKKTETGWFASDILLSLGMIGTVLGFIYMLSTSLAQVDPGNVGSMQNMLSKMGSGMSTALYTTAAGLVCSLFLKLQLFNFSSRLDFLAETKGFSDRAP